MLQGMGDTKFLTIRSVLTVGVWAATLLLGFSTLLVFVGVVSNPLSISWNIPAMKSSSSVVLFD